MEKAETVFSNSHLMSNLIRQIMTIIISIATRLNKEHAVLFGIYAAAFRCQCLLLNSAHKSQEFCCRIGLDNKTHARVGIGHYLKYLVSHMWPLSPTKYVRVLIYFSAF